jgi:gamma-D-glutamyl-L-lysine dipeptidyl-peptidase
MDAGLFLTVGLLLAEPALPASREAVIVGAVENMYSAADERVDVVSQATLGQPVEVLETSGPFARVRTPDRYEGWLALSALREYADRAAPRYAQAGRVVEVTSLMANVYREADVTTARPRVQAPLATRLEVAGEGPDEDWLAVRLPAGDKGYIQKGDVKAVEAGAPRPGGSGEEIVATARRFLGVPYLWGGMTVHGIDCSGLASRAYHANGIEIPRDADKQFEDPAAKKVERAELQPGDLLFFGSGPQHITHVGLYIADGRFIDATTHETPTVHEDRLDDPHWSSLYQGARRPR